MEHKMRVIFDSNIWVSFAIGKRINEMKVPFMNPNVDIFVCRKLMWEVGAIIEKPKLAKYISQDRKEMLLDLMKACHWADIEGQTAISRDPKDDFLLDLATVINADFLITGDKDLLVLKKYLQTHIVSFSSFMAILEIKN